MNWFVFLVVSAVACVFVAILLKGERKTVARETGSGSGTVLTIPEREDKPGIYLLSGFHVIDREKRDITGEFTPIMKQLLSLIILHSVAGRKGISNARLKELLWYDKSEESSRNNRSVHISKIRLLLESVGDFEITNASSYWMICEGENGYCDYMYAVKTIRGIVSERELKRDHLAEALIISSWGALLPNMMVDWLDAVKAEYSDSVIHMLWRFFDDHIVGEDYNTIIKLADGVLRFDSLDEIAVRHKCRAFVALKRNGAARSTFDLFVKEYRLSMGHEYGMNFNTFLHS